VNTGCATSGLRQQPLTAAPAGAPAAVRRGDSRRAPVRARLTASWRGGYQRYIRVLNSTINPADSTACQSKFNLLQINRRMRSHNTRPFWLRRDNARCQSQPT
jgi:hypothetical protein